MLPVHIYSARTLEDWDSSTPWRTGIGGSETSHIEIVERLAKRSISVRSYAPLPSSSFCGEIAPCASWDLPEAFLKAIDKGEPGIFINYRDANAFKRTKHPKQHFWFVAQDVDYAWDDETLAKVDRYICLCKEHALYTAKRYKVLKGKIFISSNGVRSDYLKNFQAYEEIKRVPYRMLYASSPDRGLKLLLQQWFRIRERFPEASLHVAYGFNNVDTIIRAFNSQGHVEMKSEIEALLNQEGVTWLGRLPQAALYREWFEASVWPYPSDWPETSCITCMDAQACGAIPVTTNFWAQGENVQFGYKIDGLPQKSELVRSMWLSSLYKALAVGNADIYNDNDPYPAERRSKMMTWARKNFDWERIVDQWVKWLEEDSCDALGATA